MNKEYVLIKLAKEFSPLERGLLEPESPVSNSIGTGVLGGLLGGSIGAIITTDETLKDLEKNKAWGKFLKRIGIGAAIGGASLGTLGYLLTKEQNEKREKDPEEFLLEYGRGLRNR